MPAPLPDDYATRLSYLLKYERPLGWRCPVCKRGLAPHVTVCPCFDDEMRRRTVSNIDVFRRMVEDVPSEA